MVTRSDLVACEAASELSGGGVVKLCLVMPPRLTLDKPYFVVVWVVNNCGILVLPLIQLEGWQSSVFILFPKCLPWAKLNIYVYSGILRTHGQLEYSTELYNCSQPATGLVYLT